MCFLRDRGKEVRGIEPVAAMIEKAELNGVPKVLLLQGSGTSYRSKMDHLMLFSNVESCTTLRTRAAWWQR